MDQVRRTYGAQGPDGPGPVGGILFTFTSGTPNKWEDITEERMGNQSRTTETYVVPNHGTTMFAPLLRPPDRTLPLVTDPSGKKDPDDPTILSWDYRVWCETKEEVVYDPARSR